MHRQVHLAEVDGLQGFLLPIDGDRGAGVALVVLDKTRTLHEHATRATGGIENTPIKRFDDLDDQFHQGGWSEKLTTTLALRHSKLAQEIFIDLAEEIALNIHGDTREGLEQGNKHVFVQVIVGPRQDSAQILVFRLDSLHSIVDGFANVFALWEFEQVGETRLFREIHDTFRLVVDLAER